MDLFEPFGDAVWATQHGDRRLDLAAEVVDYPGQLPRVRILLPNTVHDDRSDAGVDVVADVVKGNGKRVDVFAVEGSDKRFVQLVRYLVSELVAAVLDILDPRSVQVEVRIRIVEHFGKDRGRILDLPRHLREKIEIDVFTRQ